MNYKHYREVPPLKLESRRWPGRKLEKAPVWCSVDLRDGNQALMEPMVVEEKIEFFNMLVRLGFKQIEVGFPSASGIEFDFIRQLADRRLIPEDVQVQVLCQCREHLLDRTFEALEGIHNVIFHIYNNNSRLQRETVYNMTPEELRSMAVSAVRRIRSFAENFPGSITLEYSPESFTETEPEIALAQCNAVIDAWEPGEGRDMIVNLPSTVENTTPNIFADKVEWMSDRLHSRERIILSVHPHNDRGTGVAAAELALLAGAQRIEGTLFGNGERAGNVDLLNIAYNLMSQGVDPCLNADNVLEIRRVYEHLVKLKVEDRHPYAGDMVFTAFSGGHQDAINKGLKAMAARNDGIWQVPYLLIDPADVGRSYEPLVRINSQSGMGGVAFIMENHHGFKLPKGMRREFSDIIQTITEREGELDSDRIMSEFKSHYIDMKEPYHFKLLRSEDITSVISEDFHTLAEVTYTDHGRERTFTGKGNGPIDAVKTGLQSQLGRNLRILDYSEHALREGSNAQAAAYIHLMDSDTGMTTYGVGVSSSTTRASIRAIFSALNRMEAEKEK